MKCVPMLIKNLMNLTRNLMKNLVNLTINLMNLTNRFAVLNAKVNILIAIIVGIFTLIVAPILVLMLRDRINQRNSVEIAAENKEESAENVIRGNLTDNQQPEFA